MSKAPKDKQNLERDVHLRYCTQSGQSSIHGDTLYEVQTQESQSFAFPSGTGQGSTGKGPGTGKAVLYTPGCSMEILGEGLKVRDNNDKSQILSKIIKAQKGDIHIQAVNGDITLEARNINLIADGGDQGGEVNVSACRMFQVNTTGDIRLQAEKVMIDAKNTTNIVSKGFLELKSGFLMSASFADEAFGSMSQVLKAATTITPPTL